jgi:hypothetical protein
MRSRGFEQLRQRVIAAYHLAPLEEQETRGYIHHRLKMVGWQGDPAFRDDAFAGIQEFTGGVPRRINLFCDRLMLFAYLEGRHEVDAGVVQSVVDDIIEEQGGPNEYDESATRIEREEPAKPPADGERRIAAVEDSMSELASSMKEELAMLRRALLERDGKK